MAANLGTLTLDLVAKVGNFTSSMKQAGDSVDKESKRIEASIGGAISSLKSLGAAAAAGITIGMIVDTADGYTQMAAQIRNATHGAEEYQKVQKHLLETANTTYRSLQEAQQVYLDVGGALKAYGATTEQSLRITDSLSFSFTHNATAADKAKTATDAFMKSVYSGKVSGDSFRSMLSAIPSIVDDLSASMGKSKDVILTMGNAGEISADQLKTAFDKSREANEQLANDMENSLKDGLTKLKNEFTVLVGELNITYGITNKVAAGISAFGETLGVVGKNLDVVGVATGVLATAYTAKLIPTIYATGSAFTVSTIEAVRYQVALAAMAAQSTGTSVALTLLSGAVKSVATFMTGPIGLVIAAAAVTAGYISMKNRTAEATAELERQASVADKTKAELLALEGAQRRAAEEDLESAFKAQNKELKELNFTFNAHVIAIQNANRGNVEVIDISNQVRQGIMSQEEAIARLNKLPFVTPAQIKNLTDANEKYVQQKVEVQKTADAQATYGVKVELAGNAASNAIPKFNGFSTALDGNKIAAQGASAALGEYMTKLQANAARSKWVSEYAKRTGMSSDQASTFYDLKQENGGAPITQSQANEWDSLYKQGQAVKELDAARAAAAQAEKQRATEAANSAKKAQNDSVNAAKKAQAAASKLSAENYRAFEQSKQTARSLVYEYGTAFQQIDMDLEETQRNIALALLKPADRQKMLEEAKEISEARKKLYSLEYQQDVDNWSWKESEKLAKSFAIEKARLQAATGMTKEEKSVRIQSLNEQYVIASKWQKLNDAQVLNDAQSVYHSDLQRITSKYEFEREQIRLTYQFDQEMQDFLLAASQSTQDKELGDAKRQANWDYQKAANFDTSADEDKYNRDEAFKAAFEWQLITQEQYQEKMLESERRYQIAKVQIGLSASEAAFGNMASALGSMVGEQSDAYKAMFAIQKGFAVAQALMAVPETYSQAYNAVVGIPMIGPYIAPVVGATAAAAQVAQAASIKGMSLTGMAHDGIANIPQEGTWLLNKGERVLNPQDNKAFTQLINSNNQSAPTVNIYPMPGQTADVEWNDGVLEVRMRKIAEDVNKQSWRNLGRPSSDESKAFRQHTTARPAR
ncbi:tape measure protein [Acinetobacter rudis]|uniref:tape measure protein n=1 Tax=Acinetobacter rudis TaxID=632955 RepID=UPI00333F128C